MAATLEEELENYRRTGRFSAGVEADPVASFLAKELPSTPFPMRKPPEPDAASVSSGVLASPYVPDEIDDWRRTGSFKRLVAEDPAAAFVAANQPADEADVSTGVLADDRPFPTRVASAAVAPQTPAQRAVVKAPGVAAPSFEIMKPGASPFGLQANRKDLQFALGGGPSLDFLKGRAGVAAQAEQEKQRFVARAGQAGGEPTKAPVPAREANATLGTTTSGIVAPAAPATDGGRAAEPVVAAGAPSVGAGGDEGIDRAALAEALARGGEAIFRGVTGRALPTGIPEMLAAVRQRREAQAQREREIGAQRASEALRYEREASLEQAKTERAAANERQANKAYANVLRSMYPEQAKAGLFDSLDDAAGKPQFAAIARAIESSLSGAVQRPKIEAQTAEIPLEGASKRAARESRTAVDKARVNKIYSDMRLEGARLALDERKVLDAAAKTPDPAKKLEGLNKIADQKDFGGFRTMVSDLQAVEEAAPGFVTQGKVPTWLTSEQMYLAQTVPAMADPKVVKFVSAFSTLKNEDRHRLYGSAQTEGELRSYLQQLNDSPFSAGPQVLAQQVGTLTKKASEKATGRIRRYNQVFGADNVNNVLGGEWQGFYGKGGVLSQAKTPFVGAESAAAPVGDRVRVRAPDGQPGTIQRSQLEAAKKAGYVEIP